MMRRGVQPGGHTPAAFAHLRGVRTLTTDGCSDAVQAAAAALLRA